MPELPEVETMKLQLAKYLVGHTIKNVEIRNPKYEIRKEDIIGGKIVGTRRFGKVSVIDLDNGYSILTHVKLTGQYIYKGPNLVNPVKLSKKVIGGVPGPHTLVIFNLDRDGKLYYNDVRRFGWIRVEETKNVEKEKFIVKLGPEPFGSAQGHGPKLLTLDLFREILEKTSRPIKIVLMDQTKIGGVGNIYANDALWLAKINPKTPSNQLINQSTNQLFDAILSVLKSGLKYGGASELSFVTPDGKEGEYQNHTLVYGLQGEICKHCNKTKLEKYFLGGRGTYVCPVCQYFIQ